MAGKAWFGLKCGSQSCKGAMRRFYFCPTGKAPVKKPENAEKAPQGGGGGITSPPPFPAGGGGGATQFGRGSSFQPNNTWGNQQGGSNTGGNAFGNNSKYSQGQGFNRPPNQQGSGGSQWGAPKSAFAGM